MSNRFDREQRHSEWVVLRWPWWVKVPIGLVFLLALLILAVIAVTPVLDRWGTMNDEIAATLPGDELVSMPRSVVNRAVTIQAKPEKIFPWLLQLGAGKGGYYSYTFIETYLLRCTLVNADRIHPEWQNLKVGDPVKMCPSESGPPPYQVAQIIPGRALILGHQNPDGTWSDTWQFVLLPRTDGPTRLVLRTRSNLTGLLWDVIHPGVFVMERGMLLGIQKRAKN
jgi:hypothetical protein